MNNTYLPYGIPRPQYHSRFAPAYMGQVEAGTITKWVIIPGATVAALFVITALLRGRRRKRRK